MEKLRVGYKFLNRESERPSRFFNARRFDPQQAEQQTPGITFCKSGLTRQ